MPFGQLPVLEMEGGVTLCQSRAIARYLARKFGKSWEQLSEVYTLT